MKPLPLSLLCLLLALVGFVVGSQAAKPSRPEAQRQAAGAAGAAGSAGDLDGRFAGRALRDPRTGATFAESRERLRELSRAKRVGGAPYLLEGQRHGQRHLEIERIFALASLEDLVDFFAEDGPADDARLLTAAFSRFAALSPDLAVSVWSDLFRRSGNPEGVDGLVGAWARLDPAAAERWVETLADPKPRQGALFSLLEAALESDPALVERRFTEIEESFESIDLTSRLAWQLDPTRLPAFASRILDETRGKWEYQNQLVALLEVWAERDGAAMMAWVTAQAPDRFRDHVIHRVAEAGAAADPVAFLRGIGPSLDQNPALAEMAGQAWMTWLAGGGDDDEAMAWFQSHGEKLQVPKRYNWHLGGRTSETAERVLERLSALPDSELTQGFTGMILHGLARTDPESALAHGLARMPEGREREVFLTGSVLRLAQRGDPAAALEWAVGRLPAGQGQIDAVGAAMQVWAEKQPRLAAEHAVRLPAPLRERALGKVAHEWSQRAPDQVVDYLSEVSDPAAQKVLARSAFFRFGVNHSGETLLARALALPDKSVKAEAVGALFRGWSQANLETSSAALASLEPGPLRDEAIGAFVRNAAQTDRAAAVAWSLDIGDPQKRRETTLQQGRYWLNADRATATRWIEASETLPEEWKAQLLGRGQ